MALGPNGRRASRHTGPLLDNPESERSSRVATINAENSALVERFRRDRANVRPYVRTSTQKLKWTHELHQCFMRAVDKLGGQDKATPKRILQHMNRDGITIAHIKSHLQMFRSGKINAEGLSKAEYQTWQGGQWRSSNAGQMAGPATSSEAAHSKSRFEELEPAMALIQLREDSGRSNSDSGAATASELLTGSPDSLANLHSYVHKKSRAMQQLQLEDAATDLARGFVVELNDKLSPRREQAVHQHDVGQSSTYQPLPWTSPSCDSFLCETSTLASHPVDVTDALSGSKRKAEEVNIELTMSTRALRPSFQFASSPTAEEANLNLALS